MSYKYVKPKKPAFRWLSVYLDFQVSTGRKIAKADLREYLINLNQYRFFLLVTNDKVLLILDRGKNNNVHKVFEVINLVGNQR